MPHTKAPNSANAASSVGHPGDLPPGEGTERFSVNADVGDVHTGIPGACRPGEGRSLIKQPLHLQNRRLPAARSVVKDVCVVDYGNPYAAISEFWGEGLTPELAVRIANAPGNHLDEFREFLHRSRTTPPQLPKLEPGNLRPVVASGITDMLAANSFRSLGPARVASSLLVCAHEVVLNDVTHQIIGEERDARQECCDWLIAVKPLFDKQLIHFRIIDEKKRHPSWYRYYKEYMDRVDEMDRSSIASLVLATVGSKSLEEMESAGRLQEFERDIALQVLIDTAAFFGFERTWPRQVHRLLRTGAERDALKFILAAAGKAEDADALRLLNLVRIGVPTFGASAAPR